jgi:hypothetical protein
MSTARPKTPRSYFPSIEQKYGRPIEEWMRLLDTPNTRKHSDLVTWLKTTHNMGHGHATALVAVYLNPTL